jgi:outer membrane protein OmpA-like peptidoglycan-associated protein
MHPPSLQAIVIVVCSVAEAGIITLRISDPPIASQRRRKIVIFMSDFESPAISLDSYLRPKMISLNRRQLIRAGTTLTLVGFGLLSVDGVGFAAQPDTNDEVDRIARALTPRVRRGAEADHSAEQETIERLKNVRLKRGGLNLQERDELYEASRPLPQIALEINFAFDSADLLPDTIPRLDALGQVLSRPTLQTNNIVISGHTDHKGTAEYNQKLSERRADSVVDYLVKKFPLDRSNLTAVGYGFDKLKNAADPLAAENRRVEIVNGGHP